MRIPRSSFLLAGLLFSVILLSADKVTPNRTMVLSYFSALHLTGNLPEVADGGCGEAGCRVLTWHPPDGYGFFDHGGRRAMSLRLLPDKARDPERCVAYGDRVLVTGCSDLDCRYAGIDEKTLRFFQSKDRASTFYLRAPDRRLRAKECLANADKVILSTSLSAYSDCTGNCVSLRLGSMTPQGRRALLSAPGGFGDPVHLVPAR